MELSIICASVCPLQIVSPVAGLAKPAGTNAISIKPSTAGFTDYEIILSNIRLSIAVENNGTFVDAGQVGVVVDAGGGHCCL